MVTLAAAGDAVLGTGGLSLGNGGTLRTGGGFASARAISLFNGSLGGGVIDAFGGSATFNGVISGAGGLTVASSVGTPGVVTLTNAGNS